MTLTFEEYQEIRDMMRRSEEGILPPDAEPDPLISYCDRCGAELYGVPSPGICDPCWEQCER